jgi:tRNA1(Val) A37 N6-methylase TrmN6
MKTILDHVHKIDRFNNFIDIGSGRGKLPLYVAGLPNISKSVGIELVTDRYNDALEIKNKLNDYKNITNKVIFINDDFLNVNYLKQSKISKEETLFRKIK